MAANKAVLLLVAVGFGLSGVVTQRYFSPPAVAHLGAPTDVRLASVWEASLPDLEATPQPLAQWLGQVVVLNFWAPWCPPCRREIPDFMRMQDSLGAQGLQFVGVALDTADQVIAYSRDTGINYPILLGGAEGNALSRAAGNRLGGLPYTVVFDRRGNAVATLTGGVSEAQLEALVRPLL